MPETSYGEYHNFFSRKLYPLQDKFLDFFHHHNNGNFYLTGGTALSRFYFQHRYSEDLDFFSCNELVDFRSVVKEILDKAGKQGFIIEVETITDHFLRLFVKESETDLKIDFVNEVTSHWGDFRKFSLFPCVDNELNILSNKISCISRHEVKDIADIWILAKRVSFSWRTLIEITSRKSPVDPVDVSKIIKTLPMDELSMVKWAFDVNLAHIYSDLQKIAEDILLGRTNSLNPIG